MAALFGSRLRKGATTTAVAAVAIAALSASQAPGALPVDAGGSHAADVTPPPGTPVSGNSSYYTELPPLTTPDKPGTSVDLPGTGTAVAAAEADIPATVLSAYQRAEQTVAETRPGCNLPWQLLAAIGKVESGHARDGQVDDNGTTLAPILGPVLNGVGFANISDTDNGEFDGDAKHDRAVGPMQFIPSTWRTWGKDGNGDGVKDPNNIFDAALAAAYYLCAGQRDLSIDEDLHRAILGYNHSREYLNTVLSWFQYYKKGAYETPVGTGTVPVSTGPLSPSASPTVTAPSTPGTPKPSGSPSTGPKTSPSPSPSPDKPGTSPGTSKPTRPGGGTTSPSPGDSGSPTTPAPKPVATRIEKTGTAPLTAVAGSRFAQQAAVRTVDAAGKPVAKTVVRFEIVGDTDARFVTGLTTSVDVTGVTGTASAPALQAGERTGDFTIRATAVVPGVAPVDFAASVTARRADALARTTTQELTAAPGTEFASPVEVKATYQGAAAGQVAVSAAVITSATDATAPAAGPYFKDANGAALRTLTELRTDADGVLRLPGLYAADAAGTYLLRLETEGGATLTIELKVA
ncbi:lytic transglycosylase domain-containing protein [Streptomyces corynorhini]|uniref:Lytic transglycosylase n=1 Tax=Streptomyces corynorhini TaxID=2282652 RepID=A0A370BCE9_9ACTN|nr:lytic transglycosylase domain-containing protein [Streptomyces corynorhini]RDG37376.1 lytic transglycosylase [Streptomyces corynorhini]